MKVFCYNREEGAGGKIVLLITLDFHGVETLGDDDREALRQQVSEMTEQYCSEHFYTVFDDEVTEILSVLNAGTIIGQRRVGVGGPYSGSNYKDVYCIIYDEDEQHPDGSWMRNNFSIHDTCGQEGMWKNKDEARLTLYHYYTGLAVMVDAVDLPEFAS